MCNHIVYGLKKILFDVGVIIYRREIFGVLRKGGHVCLAYLPGSRGHSCFLSSFDQIMNLEVGLKLKSVYLVFS